MIPVLVDGVKKYLLTEEEVDAKSLYENHSILSSILSRIGM